MKKTVTKALRFVTAALTTIAIAAGTTFMAAAAEGDILDFATQTYYKMYQDKENNKEYTGTYTNNGFTTDVTVYVENFNNYNTEDTVEQYGPHILDNKTIMSFETDDDAASYAISMVAGNGSATINVCSDKDGNKVLATGDSENGVIYNKTNTGAETLYICTGTVNNFYLKNITISKQAAIENPKVTVKGSFTGIGDGDKISEITFTSLSSGNVTATYDECISTGVELYANTEYTVTAKGEKAVYKAESATPSANDESIDIALERIVFDFPLTTKDSYEDYKLYIDTFCAAEHEDAYSGITVYRDGMNFGTSPERYGAKTNNADIISFKAKESGVCKVTIDVTAEGSNGKSDKIVLKVNDKVVPNAVVAVQGKPAVVSAMVKAGDKVTLHNTHLNLFYSQIDVAYDNNISLTTKNSGSIYYVEVPESIVDSVSEVGIAISKSETTSFEESDVISSDTVYSSISDGTNVVKASEGTYIFGVSDDNVLASGNCVYGYCKTSDGNVFTAPVVK